MRSRRSGRFAAESTNARRKRGFAGRSGTRLSRVILEDDEVGLEARDDRDPFAIEPEELAEVQVVATMVGGRWTHNPPPWD